jgi:hypothetical protein
VQLLFHDEERFEFCIKNYYSFGKSLFTHNIFKWSFRWRMETLNREKELRITIGKQIENGKVGMWRWWEEKRVFRMKFGECLYRPSSVIYIIIGGLEHVCLEKEVIMDCCEAKTKSKYRLLKRD